jgi:hypothetical protein
VEKFSSVHDTVVFLFVDSKISNKVETPRWRLARINYSNVFLTKAVLQRKNMKIYSLILIFLLAPMISWACSCINAGDFCSILPTALEQNKLVVRGNPVRVIGHGMEFEVTEVVAGQESSRRIMVWGDPGYLCRVYVTGFERSDELLMILDPITRERAESTTGETERVGDYALSVCGQYFVYLNGRNKANVDCYKPGKKKPVALSVFPNPTAGTFRLNNPAIRFADITEVNVYLPNGQLRYGNGQVAVREQDEGIEIATTGWVNNLYLVEIRTTQGRWLAKVLVVR